MTDAFIYDAVRTPRGRGKADGSLHEVTALNLASQTLGAIKDRNNEAEPCRDAQVLAGAAREAGEGANVHVGLEAAIGALA